MPTYEYLCRECKARFSLFLPMSKREEALCPKCGSKEVQLIPSWQGGISGGPGNGWKTNESPAGVPDASSCNSCGGDSCPFDN